MIATMKAYKAAIQRNYSRLLAAASRGRKPLRDKLIVTMLAQPAITYELLASLRANELLQDAAGNFWINRPVLSGYVSIKLPYDASKYMLEHLETNRLHGTNRLVLGVTRSTLGKVLCRLQHSCNLHDEENK